MRNAAGEWEFIRQEEIGRRKAVLWSAGDLETLEEEDVSHVRLVTQ